MLTICTWVHRGVLPFRAHVPLALSLTGVGFSCTDPKWHTLEGAHSITCQSDGMWSDIVPKCKPIYETNRDNSYGRNGESGMKDDTWWSEQMRGYASARKAGHFDNQGLDGTTGINFNKNEMRE